MAKPKAKPVRVSVFMPAKMDDKIERLARADGVSKSAFIAAAVAIYMNVIKPKAA